MITKDIISVTPKGVSAIERLEEVQKYKHDWCGMHEGVAIDELECVQCLRAWVGSQAACSAVYESLLCAIALEGGCAESTVYVRAADLAQKVKSFEVRGTEEGAEIKVEAFVDPERPHQTTVTKIDEPCTLCGEPIEEGLIGTCARCTAEMKADHEERAGTADNCKSCGQDAPCELQTYDLHHFFVSIGRRVNGQEVAIRALVKDALHGGTECACKARSPLHDTTCKCTCHFIEECLS